MPQHHRVIVVGGGVAGASVLFHLAERGMSDCVLFEKRGLANGSTGHAPAFIETQYLRPDRVRLCSYSLALYERFAREQSLRFAQVGKLLLGREADLASFESSVAFQDSIGFEGASVLSGRELERVAARVNTSGFDCALWGPRDGYVDPGQLCRTFVAEAERRGARAFMSKEVLQLATRSDGGYKVETDRGTYFCDILVNATGAWGNTFGRDLGVDVPVRGYRRQIAAFELDRSLTTPLPLVVEAPLGQGAAPTLYLREDGPDRILAGIHDESVSSDDVEDPDGYDRTSDADFRRSVAALTRDRLSSDYELRPAGGWAGLYPLSPDREPILGEMRTRPGLFNAMGLGGNGIQLSGAVGRVISDLVLDGQTDLVPSVEDYRLERFT